MNELELFTSEELIEELLNRNTFAGIIIKSAKELKNPNNPILNWEIFVRNISTNDTKTILSIISDNIPEEEENNNE